MFFENEQFHINKIHFTTYYAPTEKKKYVYPGCLPTYELMYYVSGDVLVKYNGKSYHMTEGDILYLPKGIEGAEYTVDVKENFVLYNVYFDTDEEMPKTPIHLKLKSKEIGLTYEKLYANWMSKKETYYYKSIQSFYRILELIKKDVTRYSTKEKSNLIKPAEEYISLHYCDVDFNYDMLHRLSGISYTYFKKIFIDKYGVPPSKYINFLKIERACELLSTNTFKIGEIAEMCGFSDHYYFSSLFKKVKGVSPSAYKLKNTRM